MISNKGMGNRFEQAFCETLAEYGFWAHNMAQTAAGQPADVIAVRNGMAELIDCKVCTNRYFSTERIEGNQWTAMELWKERGNGTGWFAVKFGDNVYMISLDALKRTGRVSLNEEWFKRNASLLEDWAGHENSN